MVRIFVKVIPNASKSEVVGLIENNTLKIKIKEPATDSKANRALISLIAQRLSIAKKHISISSGEKIKTKILSIDCPFSVDQIFAKLLINSDADTRSISH